ncbi:sensor histidine kinase [Streptomyces sp. NPDC056835]|uniref:sensor histidine kinase n=1 Tax=Streptomyces sp. NPDC056835 TaxID=3345956 RepID=UPI00369B9FD1
MKWDVVKLLRAAARALREDLLTSAAAPLRRVGRQRWLDWLPVLAVPLVLGAVLLLAINTNQYAFQYRMGVPTALVLAGVQSAALIGALFRPILAWWASIAAMVGLARFADPFVVGTMFPWTGTQLAMHAGVLFLVALRVRPRASGEVLVISALTGLVCGPLFSGRPGDFRPVAAVLTVAVVVGALLRGRRVARTELVVQEELTAEERAKRTLLEERNRIARELHDVVAHHMSVISIQAQVAPHLVENPSEELKENLAGIRKNAVDALTELRRVLGVLRSEDALSEGVRHAPQPTLDRLDELVGTVRGAGVTVTGRTTGEPRPLPPGVELSAFRIVQEALSNAMRHAPGAEVRVTIGYHPSVVTVQVTNTAPHGVAGPAERLGHGLLGMRERAAMLGGELAAGPLPDGGYEVTATLPVASSALPASTKDDA